MINIIDFKNLNIKKFFFNSFPNINKIPKLMIYNRKKDLIIHDKLSNLYKYFNKSDIIIANNSKAYPIKYNCYKIKNNAKSYINIFLKKELNPIYNIWDILVNPARKIRTGNKIYFKDKNKNIIEAIILNNTTSKGRILKFNYNNNFKLKKNIFPTGKFLLPPYIKKNKNININYYQNTYSKIIGSLLFPTIGVYIDKYILLLLKLNKIKIKYITLHLNFNKIIKLNNKNINKSFNLKYEKLIINEKIISYIKKKYKKNIKICSFGSNTLRSIETMIYNKSCIIKYNGYINQILHFPFKYKFFNSFLTYFNDIDTFNFISLLNFCGINKTYEIYKEAIKNKYIFNTYGDLLLII
ncbi:MAG: S-adenosylmethionine:tRNA ribosyltransferase-isomerase [Candidatus Shikimatogenerans bostrichidophilus]|nr:MAG: S-adenosylmethionine:tRNA ribosyltransferase-isomerase [Candidatus Shikimatogenerans bostrichidophilus]